MKNNRKKYEYDEDYEKEIVTTPEPENPFDIDTHTPLEIIYECGRHGLPKMHAIRLLRNHISEKSLQEYAIGLQVADSEESQMYEDGVAMGEAEMSAALRNATINSEKDSYKSMSAEERRKSINAMIEKNFGTG